VISRGTHESEYVVAELLLLKPASAFIRVLCPQNPLPHFHQEDENPDLLVSTARRAMVGAAQERD
jgi:hypothetical protein